MTSFSSSSVLGTILSIGNTVVERRDKDPVLKELATLPSFTHPSITHPPRIHHPFIVHPSSKYHPSTINLSSTHPTVIHASVSIFTHYGIPHAQHRAWHIILNQYLLKE